LTSDEFARELFEDAKHSLVLAKSNVADHQRQRHLRHALLAAFSFLELQIELVAQHFSGNEFFSLHERGIMNQRDVVFEKGVFKIKDTARYSRLQDRMLLLQSKFKGSKLSQRAWWDPLLQATGRRNDVAHPRGAVTLEIVEVERDLLAILACTSDLFEIVFGKGLPYAAFGTKPKSAH
jgi:hypothetical protein